MRSSVAKWSSRGMTTNTADVKYGGISAASLNTPFSCDGAMYTTRLLTAVRHGSSVSSSDANMPPDEQPMTNNGASYAPPTVWHKE